MEKRILKYLTRPNYQLFIAGMQKIPGKDRESFVLGVLTDDLDFRFIKGTANSDATKFKFDEHFSELETLPPETQQELEEIYASVSSDEDEEGKQGPK